MRDVITSVPGVGCEFRKCARYIFEISRKRFTLADPFSVQRTAGIFAKRIPSVVMNSVCRR